MYMYNYMHSDTLWHPTQMFGRYLLDLRNGSSAHGLAAAPTPRSHRMSTVVAPTREHLQQGGSPGRNSIGPLTQVK